MLPGSGSSIDINKQPKNSIQISNNTGSIIYFC